MSTVRPGIAGGLLVGIALLVGLAALATVADEPAALAQAGGQAAVQSGIPSTDVAAHMVATEGEQALPGEPAAVNDSGLQGVLRVLATGGPVPSEVRDPAFDYYVDLSLLGTAWVDLDASLLTDLSLQFLEGERVLRRSHRAISASEIVDVAARLALIQNDEKSLGRLEAAIQDAGNETLSAALNAAKTELADVRADEAWSVPIATTSAMEFARFKGMLQDVEAAIVVRDRETLGQLRAEVQNMPGLPETQRSRLTETIDKAVAQLPAEEKVVSETASVLDKLAHASRNSATLTIYPSPLTTCTAVPTECQAVATECPATVTECQMVSTTCPEGGSATQCPATLTKCPIQLTKCPESPTICSTQQCITQQPSAPTQCQPVQTVCPSEQCITQQPSAPTQCQSVQTMCPQQQCITQQPSAPTQCQPVQTMCPQQQCITQQPSSPTQCQPAVTMCSPGQCEQPTQYPSVPTQCKSMPTQCSATQTKSCGQPTLFPEVPTSCPAILTRCPQSLTYCPSNCGQQQQKQRWIPPKKSPSEGSYQYSPGWNQGYSETPYRRRDDYGLGR